MSGVDWESSRREVRAGQDVLSGWRATNRSPSVVMTTPETAARQ
jgi:hypothetical protein